MQIPEKRWKEHLQDYKRRRCEKRPLYSAMNKYGTEHFHFEVIEETNDAVEREKYWINELRTYVGFEDCKGYNGTLGGDGKCYLNLDEQEVVRYHIEEATYAIGETVRHFGVDISTIKNILKKNNTTWLKSTDSNRLLAYIKYGGVIQLDEKERIIINIFENSKEAAKYMNKKNGDPNIQKACNGMKRKNGISHKAFGYSWYYGKDLYLIKDKIINY